jgi:hypothetical protein
MTGSEQAPQSDYEAVILRAMPEGSQEEILCGVYPEKYEEILRLRLRMT